MIAFFEKHPVWLYVLFFVVVATANWTFRQLAEDEEWRDGNLLVNLVLNGLITTGFIIGDQVHRKNAARKKK